jgi:transcriptional regulator with XRE-family HTH domain
MLAEGLEKAESDKGWSQRQVAKLMNYKTSVVLSHMASGRVPIPIERAPDFCRLLGIAPGEFLFAVLQQRYPEIDWNRLLSGPKKTTAKVSKGYLAEELEALAGAELDELPQSITEILREVVSNRNAPKRWISLTELPVIESLRKTHPAGLTVAQRKSLEEFLAQL